MLKIEELAHVKQHLLCNLVASQPFNTQDLFVNSPSCS